MSDKNIVILGVFVADTAYRATRQPKMGSQSHRQCQWTGKRESYRLEHA